METKNIAFVSTMGQARNILSISRQRNVNIRTYIFFTAMNTQLLDKIKVFCNDNHIPCQEVEFPIYPTNPSPKKIKQIFNIYDRLLTEVTTNLFIANCNNHYTIAMKLARKKGINLLYFEEGLGSYKTKNNFQLLDSNEARLLISKQRKGLILSHESKSLILKLVLFIFRRVIKPIRFARNEYTVFKKIFVNFFRIKNKYKFMTHEGLNKLSITNKLIDTTYFDNNYDFDVAYLALEKANVNFKDEIISKLDTKLQINEREINDLKSILRTTPRNLYLDQQYSQDKNYIKILTQTIKNELKSKNLRTLTVKFHPRSSNKYKHTFLKNLLELGIKFKVYPELDDFSAEAIFSVKHFKKAFSPSSSSILYAPLFDEKIQTYPICRAIIDEYNSANLKPPKNLINDCITLHSTLDKMKN